MQISSESNKAFNSNPAGFIEEAIKVFALDSPLNLMPEKENKFIFGMKKDNTINKEG